MKDNGSHRLKTPPKRFISYFGTSLGPFYFLDFLKRSKKIQKVCSSHSDLLQNDSDLRLSGRGERLTGHILRIQTAVDAVDEADNATMLTIAGQRGIPRLYNY